jgi:glycerol-3-phosphate dehydrogenase
MRPPLSAIDGRRFDVAVIGAGVNGASAAQHVAGAGYSVLLVDKGDFCSGSSSRSSRLLHCGLRYLAPGGSLWDFAFHPSRLKVALGMARQAMLSRHQFVQTSPERVKPLNFHFPLWRDGAYKPWQVDLALRILASLAPGDVPLDVRRINPEPAGEVRASQSRGWLFDSARLTTQFEQRVFRRSAENSGLLITTEAMVAEAPKRESAPMPGGGGGMGGMGGMDF